MGRDQCWLVGATPTEVGTLFVCEGRESWVLRGPRPAKRVPGKSSHGNSENDVAAFARLLLRKGDGQDSDHLG